MSIGIIDPVCSGDWSSWKGTNVTRDACFIYHYILHYYLHYCIITDRYNVCCDMKMCLESRNYLPEIAGGWVGWGVGGGGCADHNALCCAVSPVSRSSSTCRIGSVIRFHKLSEKSVSEFLRY